MTPLSGPITMFLCAVGIIACAILFAIPDVRGCPASVLPIDAAHGKIKCPTPKTTTYGFNRPVKEVRP